MQQRFSRAAIRCLATRQQEGQWASVAVAQGVDFGAASTTADAKSLGFEAPFPPAAQRCAFTWVLSSSTVAGGPPAAARVSNTVCQTPWADQRTKRLYSVLRGPYSEGTSIHRPPDCRATTMPLITDGRPHGAHPAVCSAAAVQAAPIVHRLARNPATSARPLNRNGERMARPVCKLF